MKISTGILALLLPASAIAQNYPGMGAGGMSEQDMQNMMQKAQEMQACMQGIDQSRLQEFEQRAYKVEAEVKSLCASGKRDDAQQEAIAFAREVSNNPEIGKITKCSEIMKGTLPQMSHMVQTDGTEKSAPHVCDQ